MPAEVRWASEGQVGLKFERTINIEQLTAPPPRSRIRKAG